ncbi:MAG: C40 family peptidase [Lachnospiraceae bacterium]|nr:C40 family peptidase [Lachnospiraceae bacterium]
MKKRMSRALSLCLIAGLVFPSALGVTAYATEADAETEIVAEAADTEAATDTVSETAVDEEPTVASKEEAAAEATEAEAADDTESEDAEEAADEEDAAEADDSVVGTLAFAQCEEYVNIRSEASLEGEVVAKIYNNEAATVVSVDGEWYEITSGNAYGYAKAEYFATGEEAEAIAEEVAYNVARVYAYELNVRSEASTDSDVITVAYEGDEIEVVLYGDDWMKVALGDDVYGYVNSDYVEYVTYYPVAETIEEEEIRLAEEAAAAAETADEDTVEEEASVEETAEETVEETVVTEEETTAVAETYAVAATYAAAETEATVAETEAYVEQTEAYVEQTEAYVEQTEAETSTTVSSSSSSSSSTGLSIAYSACNYVGYSYVWGGASPSTGFDCSGLVQYVYGLYGYYLPHNAASQSGYGTAVTADTSSLQAGDLIFYDSDGCGSICHVGIYVGNGTIVHAANSSKGVVYAPYNCMTIVCARRICS